MAKKGISAGKRVFEQGISQTACSQSQVTLRRNVRKLIAIGAFALFASSIGSSCPVCFGAKDSRVTEATVPAIGVMLGCTGIVAVGIGAFARRIIMARKDARPTEAAPPSHES